jgi:hypothetical protein
LSPRLAAGSISSCSIICDWRSLTEASRLRWRAHAGVGGHYLLDAVVVRIRRARATPEPAQPPRPAA